MTTLLQHSAPATASPAERGGPSSTGPAADAPRPAEHASAAPAVSAAPPLDPRMDVIRVVARTTLLPVAAETPVETEILSEEDLRELPATNAAEALEGIPGIRLQSRIQGEGAAVSIEGMPPTYTMILVNGHRYSGELGGVDDLRDVPLANVERIEIQRGAQGLRYGSEAGGGVINIVTKDPPIEGWSLDLDGGGGDYEKVLVNGTPAFGRGAYGASVTADYDRIGGYSAPENLQGHAQIPFGEDSRRTSYDVYGTFRWIPAPELTSRTRFGWRHRDENLVSDLASDSADAESDRRYQRWLASEEWRWEVGEDTRLDGAVTYFHGKTDSDVGRTFEMNEDEVEVDLSAEQFFELWDIGSYVTLGGELRSAGLDLEQQPFLSPDNPDLAIDPNTNERVLQGGVYLLAETQLTSWLLSEVGARVQLDSETSPEVLPQAALLITPWQGGYGRAARIRLSAGRNYRVPSLRERYQPPVAQLGGGYFLEGNPDLEAEKSTSYRAALELEPLSWLSTSVTGFYNDISNHIRSSYDRTVFVGFNEVPADTSPGSPCAEFGHIFPELCEPTLVPIPAAVYKKDNLDDVWTAGIEARLQLRPHPSVDLQLGYTFLETRVEDSNVDVDELPNEPHHVFDSRLTLVAPYVDTELTARARWRSGAIIEGSGTGLLGFTTDQRSEPSFTLDLRVLQPIGERLSLYADVYNVTNNRFVDSYVVRSRSFFVGLRASFD